MKDVPLIRSQVHYGDKWFWVSTADRDSSAMLGPRRFAETIVWAYDFDTDARGEQLWMGEGREGSIFTHLQVCQFLRETGHPEPVEEGAA